MHKLAFFIRKVYFLLKAFKILGLKPVEWGRYAILYARRVVSAQEYMNYKHYLKDASFKKTFLSYCEAEKYWKLLNPNKYCAIARDKYLTHLVLEEVGIPMPKLYAYFNSEAGDDYQSVRTQLKKFDVHQCVVKPAADSAHGGGVFVCNNIVYTNSDCVIEKTNGEKVSLKQLLEINKNTPLLFEERVIQTQQVNSINPSSVNTVRFMTALYPNKEVKIVATFMKFGRMGSDIDNAGDGGNVDCGIDFKKGVCYNTVQFNSFNDVKRITKHPDSDVQIEGITIKNWVDFVVKVKSFQSKVPYLKMIGWDIALTDEGPMVIEINNWWDTTGQLFIGRGWRNEVLDCYNAWKDYYSNNKVDDKNCSRR